MQTSPTFYFALTLTKQSYEYSEELTERTFPNNSSSTKSTATFRNKLSYKNVIKCILTCEEITLRFPGHINQCHQVLIKILNII